MKPNWTTHKINYELKKRGTNLTQLSINNGLSPSTLRNVLRVKYPKAERIIANFLNLSPADIWPSRYQ